MTVRAFKCYIKMSNCIKWQLSVNWHLCSLLILLCYMLFRDIFHHAWHINVTAGDADYNMENEEDSLYAQVMFYYCCCYYYYYHVVAVVLISFTTGCGDITHCLVGCFSMWGCFSMSHPVYSITTKSENCGFNLLVELIRPKELIRINLSPSLVLSKPVQDVSA